MVQCPTCGDDFATERGRNVHHASVHGESLAKSVKTCDWCGDDFEVYKSERVYCGTNCKYEARSEKYSGADHPNWKGGEATYTCEICGGEFSDRRSHSNWRRTCSLECRSVLQSKEWVGENHPNWKGGRDGLNYIGNWKKNREKALERDGYKCRACGMAPEEHREVYNCGLEVHHVIPVRKFDDPLDAHSLGNLVTACRGCHNEYEGLPIFPRGDAA